MSGSKRKRAVWDDNKDHFIIVQLYKATCDGKRSDNGFKKDVWTQLAVNFNAKFQSDSRLDASQIQTRMHTLNKNYKVFQTIVEQSGFGWDDEKKLPTAPDDVWTAYIQKHPKAATYQKETLPHYDLLREIFGKDISTGKFAEDTFQYEDEPCFGSDFFESSSFTSKEATVGETSSVYNDVGQEGASRRDTLDILSDRESDDDVVKDVLNIRKRARSKSTAGCSKADSNNSKWRHTSATSAYEKAAKTATEGLTSFGETIFHTQQLLMGPYETRFEQCMKIMLKFKEEESISEGDCFRISEEFMRSENYCSLFYVMTDDMRLTWLEYKGFLS